MKQIVVLCDGMADYPIPQLDGKTPMDIACSPNMDYLAQHGTVGLVKTVPDGLKPGSDIANLSVLGYDPRVYYSGRSPLEAASMGIELEDTDISLRCNLVTLSDDPDYENRTMIDYSAGDITTDEAHDLMKAIQKSLGDDRFSFFGGLSYRNCLVYKGGTLGFGSLTPPHDISDRVIKEYLPSHPNARPLLEKMMASCEILEKHPVNQKRIEKALRPANAIWLWGEGKKTTLPSFKDKYHLKASMISAVDLLKGIAKLAGMQVVDVDGATGYIDTDFDAKAQAAIKELQEGQDFVYIHLEAPDECGHRGELQNKVRAIELIDQKIVTPLIRAMQENHEDFKMMILPDHPTPICTRTHAADPVPFLFYSSAREYCSSCSRFDEEYARSTGVLIPEGHTLMEKFLSY